MTAAVVRSPPGEMLVPRCLLDHLVRQASVEVTVVPGTGYHLTQDWWDARIEALGLSCCGFGLDDAIIGLAGHVRTALGEGLLDTADEETAPLALRLHLASIDGTLGSLLEASAVFFSGWGGEM